ncbi:hypothetical protein GCM10010910_28140 [Microbacterium nanhaiense]|uniref:Copper homeostasis protein cutC homolog n=1 Tax=Microbacterium nanhaiense TaxID=1301026 RepID=A0ABQ2N8M3_9MICO|nr:copper homeostasis protein CutC [Microbacterium nanhaiense]GGO67110.1 hypothetical protein GCM10010910_28140 [Microbacterium nanhaiense]
MTAFEVAVQDPPGAAIAAAVGVDRIELCSALAIGGVTPSRGLIEIAVAAGTPVHVLVRPRGGGFAYDSDEVGLIVRDVAEAVRAGAAGVVFGATARGAIDVETMRATKDAAAGIEVTFHRAFDTVPDRRSTCSPASAWIACSPPLEPPAPRTRPVSSPPSCSMRAGACR